MKNLRKIYKKETGKKIDYYNNRIDGLGGTSGNEWISIDYVIWLENYLMRGD